MKALQQAVESFIDSELIDEQRVAVRAPNELSSYDQLARAPEDPGVCSSFFSRGGGVAGSMRRRCRSLVHERSPEGGAAACRRTWNPAGASALHRDDRCVPFLRFVVTRFGGDQVRLERFRRPYDVGDYSIQRSSHRYGPGERDFGRLSEFVLLPREWGQGRTLHPAEGRRDGAGPARVRDRGRRRKATCVEGRRRPDVLRRVRGRLAGSPARGRPRDSLARARFPVILVERFQDTMGLRAPCLRHLFEATTFDRGFVVGDPDQRIMTFAGARRDLFEEFEDSVALRSTSSQCATARTSGSRRSRRYSEGHRV